MNPDEYDNLAAIERDHWYYVGKRQLVHAWLVRVGALGRDRTLLDCGAGTGLFAEEMAAHCRVLVLDDHEESLRRLRARFSDRQVLRVSADGIPLPAAAVEIVTALDVLEHTEHDATVVRELARVLRPGGFAVVTVPASMALWGDWDVGLHHYRRYDRAQLCALFPGESWETVYVNYTNVVVYPLVWAVRKWRALGKRLGWSAPSSRTEDRVPPSPINALLRAQFAGLAQWRVPFPFGVSLVLVARRK